MITGELKNKVDALWNIFWTGGITNPLDVVEQMTYMNKNAPFKNQRLLGLII